jgi:hypothetical protein
LTIRPTDRRNSIDEPRIGKQIKRTTDPPSNRFMKVGAERNKVIALIVLSVIAAVTIYVQYFSGPPVVSSAPPVAVTKAAPPRVIERPVARPRPARSSGQTFRPTFSGSSDEPLDPMKVDPTLRTDLLAKVRAVEFTGVERNLFQFTARKLPDAPKPEQVAKAQELLQKADPAPAPVQRESSTPSKPKAPPIKWKFYGFANQPDDARKRAFLLDTEGAVFVATEGDVFNQRYKVVRIGVNSIVIEDLQFHDQQTLPLDAS